MNIIPVYTIARKEIAHVFKLPLQVLGAPLATTILYFLVFGQAIGSRVGDIQGIRYTEFIMPGLIMMNVVTGAFNGIFSSLILSKYMNTFTDILVSPMSYLQMILGYVFGSVGRSLLTALAMYLASLLFVPFHMEHPFFILFFMSLVGACFALLGFIVGVTVDNFEQASIFPNFIIMPLSFLGGIFYSVEMLPPFAQVLSRYNPFMYMINGMRYGFYGISDVSALTAASVVAGVFLVLLLLTWLLVRSGYKLRN